MTFTTVTVGSTVPATQLVVKTSNVPSANIYVYNSSQVNTVYLNDVNSFEVTNLSRAISLPPLSGIGFDGTTDVFAICAAGQVAPVIVIPGATSFFQPPTINGTTLVNTSQLYYEAPADELGTLIGSTGVSVAGTDPFGNVFLAGDTVYTGALGPPHVQIALQMFNSALTWYQWNGSAWIATAVIAAATALGNVAVTSIGGGTITLDGSAVNLNTSKTFIPPSGDVSGATDVAAINTALAAGAAVQLLQGSYWINAPIVIPGSDVFLEGAGYAPASTLDVYNAGGAVGQPGGSVINMVPAFAGDAGISFPDPGAASASQRYNVRLANFTINGNSITGASTIPGIHVTGAWGACAIEGVTVHRSPGDCIRFDIGASGSIADDWYVRAMKCTGSRNGSGAVCHQLPDSWFIGCEFSENALHGLVLDSGVNTRAIGCKAENNKGGHGYYFTGINSGGEIVWLTSCSSHLNWLDGFHFDGSVATAQGNYHLSQCIAQQDGQSGGAGNAGFGAAGCKSRIMMSACVSETNVTGPAFGASAITASFGLEAQTCLLLGVTAGTHDDGSNTHVLSNTNTWAF